MSDDGPNAMGVCVVDVVDGTVVVVVLVVVVVVVLVVVVVGSSYQQGPS